MKILVFKSGLGNQIFVYLFYKYLKQKYPKQKIFGYYRKKFLKKHNGLEITDVFDVILPPQNKWANFIAFVIRYLNFFIPTPLKSTDVCFNEKSIYFDGFWQDKRFFCGNEKFIQFKKFILDENNTKLFDKINSTNSVSIHVRRGDYIEPMIISMYGNICTKEYYLKAIEIIQQRMSFCKFFIFSDDILWVKENLQIQNGIYIDYNKGKDSFIDMYLMTQCKGNIIANSTFSYWGAYLNINNSFVIYPIKWFHTHTPDIFPKNWIGVK
jgi:hypothetical protein